MTHPRRLIWIVNHRTLLPAEVPILRDLGYEVLIPKIIPEHGYRSGLISFEYDRTLTLSPAALRVLNAHDFYSRSWGPTVTEIVNDNFDVIVTSLSSFLTPLREAARWFEGRLVARVFGLEEAQRYGDLFRSPASAPILTTLEAMGSRFVFGQGFGNLAGIENDTFKRNAHTITVPLPPTAYEAAGTWLGGGHEALFLCPEILEHGYYRDIYESIKRDFGDLPHVIFGRQRLTFDDQSILADLSDRQLRDRYMSTPVFVYPSTEPRHVHYSPIEAMVIGAPVLYRRDSLIDTLAGSTLPGVCADTAEMQAKARSLMAGDRRMSEEIRSSQHLVVEQFSAETAARQWRQALETHGASPA